MRKKEVIPIGQGCKPTKGKRNTLDQLPACRCQEHFWLYLNICLGCGEKFHTDRPHTATCSGKCRTRLCRMRKEVLFQSVMQFAEGLS